MKNLYALFVLLASGMLVFGQTSINPTKSDPDAKKVLDAVSAKFRTFKTVKANFTYKVENAAGKTLSSKTGSILMKGTKYRVSFSGLEIFSDGKTVWNYDKTANEVTISNLDAAAGTITPQKLFTNFYDKDFYYLLNGEKKVGTRTLQEIEMTPTDKSKSFHKVYVLIDKNAKTLYSTRVLEKGGTRYSYTVSNMNTKTALADSQFSFDKSKYPGVEVIDLR